MSKMRLVASLVSHAFWDIHIKNLEKEKKDGCTHTVMYASIFPPLLYSAKFNYIVAARSVTFLKIYIPKI